MFRCRIHACSKIPKSQIYAKQFQCLKFSSSYFHSSAVTQQEKLRPLCHVTEIENTIRESTCTFANQIILPKVKEMEEKAQFDSELLKQCFEQGYYGIEIPEKYGGSGLNFMSSILIIEELAKIDPSLAVSIDVQNTLVNRIMMQFGTEKQKDKWLPLLAQNTMGSFCLSEADSGSDAFALRTKAEDKGDHYVLNGSKCWITNAQDASLFIVMANTDFSKGYKGITAFLVDKSNPGLIVGKKEDKLGLRASSTCVVTLEDCIVPKEDVLGEVGKGYKIAIETLNEGRIGIGAQMVGLAQGAYDYALPYMKERKQFGKAIADFQGMQFQYAKAAVDIQAARLLVYEAARMKESGMPFTKEAAMAKYFSSEIASEVATKCVEWLGGVGFTKEYRAEKYYRDVIVGKIYEGTSNMNLQTIAKFIKDQY